MTGGARLQYAKMMKFHLRQTVVLIFGGFMAFGLRAAEVPRLPKSKAAELSKFQDHCRVSDNFCLLVEFSYPQVFRSDQVEGESVGKLSPWAEVSMVRAYGSPWLAASGSGAPLTAAAVLFPHSQGRASQVRGFGLPPLIAGAKVNAPVVVRQQWNVYDPPVEISLGSVEIPALETYQPLSPAGLSNSLAPSVVGMALPVTLATGLRVEMEVTNDAADLRSLELIGVPSALSLGEVKDLLTTLGLAAHPAIHSQNPDGIPFRLAWLPVPRSRSKKYIDKYRFSFVDAAGQQINTAEAVDLQDAANSL